MVGSCRDRNLSDQDRMFEAAAETVLFHGLSKPMGEPQTFLASSFVFSSY